MKFRLLSLLIVIICVNHTLDSSLGLCASGEAYPMPLGCHRWLFQKDVGWRDPKEEFHFSLMLRLETYIVGFLILQL